MQTISLSDAKRMNEATDEAWRLLRAMAHVHNGSDSLALVDCDPYEWAAQIVSKFDGKETEP